nr:Uncharacterized protein A9P81_4017 [Leptospira interrogans serovar Copenhageni/Icterohaemorrhagiae]
MINGLDESFQKYYWDIDLCLRLRRAGFRLVSNPFSEFIQTISDYKIFKELNPKFLESVNDRKKLITKWGVFLDVDDFYSSHSDLVGKDMIPKGLNHGFLEWYWKKKMVHLIKNIPILEINKVVLVLRKNFLEF